MAILRAQLQAKDFSGDSLIMVSDIQLSSQIREGVTAQRNVKPNGIQVVPYLGNIINRAKPINVYFEIYNLTFDEKGQTRFKISYEVSSIPSEKSSGLSSAIQFISHLIGNESKQTIGSSFESVGDNEFQQIYLTIDFSKFSSGPCALNISVTDLISGNRVKGQKRFVLK